MEFHFPLESSSFHSTVSRQQLVLGPWAESKFSSEMNTSVSNLNPAATTFTCRSMPVQVLTPVEIVCYLFQVGACLEKDHHRDANGKNQLHVCQLCLQYRHDIVDHSCWGHPHISSSCQDRRLGAIACPYQMESGTKSSPQISSDSKQCTSLQTEKESSNIPHLPSFFCDCNFCADFFWVSRKN